MKNLFIVHTPFNLMTAFILSRSAFADDDNYLAIMHPQSFESWQDVPVLNYMHSEACGYRKVFLLLRWFRSGQGSYRQQVKDIRDMIGDVSFDKVFLAVDIDIQAQLLLAVLGKISFYRYDEGMWSYYTSGHKRTWCSSAFHLIQLKLISFLAGIKADLEFNTEGIGFAKAALGDYLYKPELLLRDSPKVVEISNAMIQKAVNILKHEGLLKQQFDTKTILYLSQPLVEKGEVEEKAELSSLINVVETFGKEAQFLYKPHSRDSKEKIKKYKKAIPNMEIFDSKVPVELLYAAEPHLDAVISYTSSGLIFGDKFAGKQIKMFSLTGISCKAADANALKTLQNAGVVFI